MVCGGRDDVWGLRKLKQRTWLESPGFGGLRDVLYCQVGAGTAWYFGVQAGAWRNERHSSSHMGVVLSTGMARI